MNEIKHFPVYYTSVLLLGENVAKDKIIKEYIQH
jgi:hypothetical protein